MRNLISALAALTLVGPLLASCASTPPPPPPPPPETGGQGVLRDWRGIVSATDRDRYARRDAAWRWSRRDVRADPAIWRVSVI
jgi:hypothetical protein